MSKPVPTLVAYRPKPGHEKEMLALVEKHWPILDKAGLVTKDPPKIWRAYDLERGGKGEPAIYFLELFAWKDEAASDVAHQTPEIMAIWEPMGAHMASLQITKLEAVGS
jgi:hypothetical protein